MAIHCLAAYCSHLGSRNTTLPADVRIRTHGRQDTPFLLHDLKNGQSKVSFNRISFLSFTLLRYKMSLTVTDLMDAGFGSTQNQPTSLFGNQNRTGFGSTPATTGGSLFGGGTATSGGTGFGGFGSTSNTGGFGSTGTSGGLFGNKPGGFGTSTGTGGFGTGGGFGTTTGTATTGFGAAAGSAFQGAIPPCEGTGATPFNPVTEKDTSSNVTNHYQSITYMQPYSRYSFEVSFSMSRDWSQERNC